MINSQEDRAIRYLLAHDDRTLLANLIHIENNGITRESIKVFRGHLDAHLSTLMSSGSPEARRARVESGRTFFGVDENGEENENVAPERPDTAFPKKEEGGGETGGGGDGRGLAGTEKGGGGEEGGVVRPFQVIRHKVLAKAALRLRELGPKSKRQKVIMVGSGIYNPLHRLHLRMFYLARQFLEGHSHFEVLGGIVSPSHPTAVRSKFR